LKMLTPQQQQRLSSFVEAEELPGALLAIDAMEAAEELHAAMQAYNWDDGFAVPTAVLEHPACERATALLMYYEAQGPWTDVRGAAPEHGAFIQRVVARLLSGRMPEMTVSYDPALSAVEVYKLRKAGVPEELLRPSTPK
jgi:hypothetical protein